MKKAKVIFFVISAIIFLSAPQITSAACCELTVKNNSACLDIPEGDASQGRCEKTAQDFSTQNNVSVEGRYYAKKKCEKPSVWGNKCECPPGKTCVEMQVPFPGSKTIEKAAYDGEFSDILAKYIIAVFQFLVWIAISLSIFMIMVAGFMWLISAGNQGMISKAKGYIQNALYGLVITLLSYVILQTINPQLVALKMPGLNKVIPKQGKDCCMNKDAGQNIKDIDLRGKTCQDFFGGTYGGKWEVCHTTCCVCENKNPSDPALIGAQVCWWNPPSDDECAKKSKDNGGSWDYCMVLTDEGSCYSKTSYTKACEDHGGPWK